MTEYFTGNGHIPPSEFARTDVTREARSLSGCDVGREVLADGDWMTITCITHYPGGVDIWATSEWSQAELHPEPTDTVTIRGRDE